MENMDMNFVAVKSAQHVGPDDLVRCAAGGASVSQVDDAVDERQQRIHFVGGDQDGYILLVRDPVEKRHYFLGASQIEIGERLVEQKKPRFAYERVRDQDALLLATRQVAYPGISEPHGVDRRQHLVDRRPALSRRDGHAEAMTVYSECYQIASAKRHLGVEDHLLGDVPDGPVAPRSRRALEEHPARARVLKAEDHPEQGGLARPVRRRSAL